MFWRRGREQTPETAPDQELIRALLGGSEEAMAQIYRRHGGLVYRFSLRLLQDQSIAEEVTQDVFLALLKQAYRFDADRASLPTWLCGIARRLVWKQLRTRERSLAIASDEEVDEVESLDDDPCVTLTRKQAVATVDRGLDALSPDLREVVVLCELEEMRYEDVAAILAIPVGTVRSRLHRAKRRLALLLSAEAVKTKMEDIP